MTCENCGKEHAGKYGSGRFCSAKCARGFSSKYVTDEGRKKQKEVLNDKNNRIKSYNTRRSNSQNYELDSDGSWRKLSKPKKRNFKDTQEMHNKSIALGKVGELATAKKFIDHGYNVYVPLIDNGTDLIVEKDDKLNKIQVKSASPRDETGNSTMFNLRSSELCVSNGNIKTHSKKYKKKNVDYFALYSNKDDEVYLIKNDENRSTFTIRTSLEEDNLTTKGKNLEKLHMAEDYQIDRVLDDIDKGIDRSNIIEITDFVDSTEK